MIHLVMDLRLLSVVCVAVDDANLLFF
jgi:hypothetical protein